MKPSLKILINKRDRAFTQGKHQKYLRLREAVTKHISKLKNDFLTSDSAPNNSKHQWASINKLLMRSSTKCIDFEVQQLANHFSSFFIEEHTDFSLNFENLHSRPIQIKLNDVLNILGSLKKGSSGPDCVPFWIFRDFRHLLAPSILRICQLSLDSCSVPQCFKEAIVSPIPKCSQPTIHDFRPISLLPVMSKVLEKLVFKHCMANLTTSIDPLQFAFVPRAAQGTTSALTLVVHKILSFLDSPGAVRVLLLDFTKAFDRLPHSTILNSLISKGASKELVKWTQSYLTNRFQRVKVNGKLSKRFEALSGVPQGSILGPFLFALSIDSLQPKFSNSIFVKYADDVCVLHFVRQHNDDHLTEEFSHIFTWCNHNGLCLNTSKTKLMNFQTKQSIDFHPLFDPHTNDAIEVVHSARLLGIQIDDKLTWDVHVQSILSKVRKRVYLLHALRQARASKKILTTVYCSLIRSVITYAFPSWCNVASTRFALLQKFENRVSRIFGVSPNLNLLDSCERIGLHLAKKCKNLHHPLYSVFDFSATRYSARKGKSNRRMFAKTKRFKDSFIRFT